LTKQTNTTSNERKRFALASLGPLRILLLEVL
jgi:hypothetical protein